MSFVLARWVRLLFVCLAYAVLTGCASTSQQDDGSMFAPTAISDLYSKVNLRVRMAFTAHEQRDRFEQPEQECSGPTIFEQRVERIGSRLARAAYRAFPRLAERIPQFEFSVADKLEPGVASTAGGVIVVLKPVSDLSVSDDALAFVMAREIGHVISRHHEQNTTTSIAITILFTALAPALNLPKLMAVITSGSNSAAAANTVSSAASFASTRAVIASYGERQRNAADAVATRLLPMAGFDTRTVADGILAQCTETPPTRWVRELKQSVANLPVQRDNANSEITAQIPAQSEAAIK